MTETSPVADILESVLRLFPDRLGGSLSIEETALYLHRVHGMGKGNDDSRYEVARRNLPKLGIKPRELSGAGKRIWVSDLVKAMAKLRDPEAIQPKESKSTKGKGGFRSNRINYENENKSTNKRGPGADKGGVTTSTAGLITKGNILVANPEGWRWRPQRQIPVVPVRTEFVSELAAVRYKKAQERSKAFWNGVWREIEVLRATRRQAEALASPPTRHRVRPPTSRS